MINKISKKKIIIFIIVVIVIPWLICDFLFFNTYEKAVFFVSQDSHLIETVVFILNYYLADLLPYFVAIFLLLNITSLTSVYIYILDQRSFESHFKLVALGPVIYVLNALFLLSTKLWPVMLLLIIINLLIAFILYVLFKQNEDELDDNYEDYEIVKIAGPFDTPMKADHYCDKFYHYWEIKFLQKGFKLDYRIVNDEPSQYHVEIYVTEN